MLSECKFVQIFAATLGCTCIPKAKFVVAEMICRTNLSEILVWNKSLEDSQYMEQKKGV